MARRRDLASLEHVDTMAFHPKAVGDVHLAVPGPRLSDLCLVPQRLEKWSHPHQKIEI